MRLDLGPIRELQGGSIQFSGQELGPDLGSQFQIAEPLQVQGEVTNTGGGFLLQGKLRLKLAGSCGRCLEPVTVESQLELEDMIGSENPDQPNLQLHGDQLELRDYLQEQVWLNLPLKLLCQPECRGLCPRCGQNLNQKDCHCPQDELNPDFAKLSQWSPHKGGGLNGQSQE